MQPRPSPGLPAVHGSNQEPNIISFSVYSASSSHKPSSHKPPSHSNGDRSVLTSRSTLTNAAIPPFVSNPVKYPNLLSAKSLKSRGGGQFAELRESSACRKYVLLLRSVREHPGWQRSTWARENCARLLK